MIDILKMHETRSLFQIIANPMMECASEEDIFQILHEIIASVVKITNLRACVIDPTGQKIRHIFPTEPDLNSFYVSNLKPWLIEGLAPVIEDCHAHAEARIFSKRLIAGSRPLGGITVLMPEDDGDVRLILDTFADIATFTLHCLRQKRLSQMVLEALEESEEAISFYDNNDGIVFSNKAYHRVFPHYPEASKLLGYNHIDLYKMDLEAGIIDDPLARSDPEAFLSERETKARQLVSSHREIQCLGGRTYIYTRARSRTGATMSRRIDISEQTKIEAELRLREAELYDLAFRDPLTGLFNRAFLREQFVLLRNRFREGEHASFPVFLIDLNDFKTINDSYGHEIGDFVLKTIAERLMHHSSQNDVIFRLGGDEFLVILGQDFSEEELADKAYGLIAALSNPMPHDQIVLKVGTSIGVAVVTERDSDLSNVLVDADLAMYESKKTKNDKGSYSFFRESLRQDYLNRVAFVEEIRTAFIKQEFELHYQPQFLTKDRKLVGFEALVRWRHPTRGLLPPVTFISIMEEQGLIEELGKWVLETACAQAQTWPGDLRVAVNVSPAQLRNGRFSKILSDTLSFSDLPAHRLELEITESVFLEQEERIRAKLMQWKALGIRIALDDFGQGYSSLGYLNSLPIDKIKIDRSFLGEFDPNNPNTSSGVVLRAIINLGHDLGMAVIAEGVEREDQFAYLSAQSCPEVQGFLLGRPMPADRVPDLFNGAPRPNRGRI